MAQWRNERFQVCSCLQALAAPHLSLAAKGRTASANRARNSFAEKASHATGGTHPLAGGGKCGMLRANDGILQKTEFRIKEASPSQTLVLTDGAGPRSAVHSRTSMQQCNRPRGTVTLTGRSRAREKRPNDALVRRGERRPARKEPTRGTPEWNVASIWKLPGWNVVSWDTRRRCHR